MEVLCWDATLLPGCNRDRQDLLQYLAPGSQAKPSCKPLLLEARWYLPVSFRALFCVLRALGGGVGWGGMGMLTFAEVAHMLDATQLRLGCPCTRARCYASDGVGWGCQRSLKSTTVASWIRFGPVNLHLYSDGARCWPAMCEAHGIRNFHVKHNKFEFAKKLPDVKRPKKSRCRSTMHRPHVGFFGQIHSAWIVKQIRKRGHSEWKNLHLPLCLGLALPLANKGKLQSGACQNLLAKFVAGRAKKRGRQEHMSKHQSIEVKQTQTEPKNPRAFTNAWPCYWKAGAFQSNINYLC